MKKRNLFKYICIAGASAALMLTACSAPASEAAAETTQEETVVIETEEQTAADEQVMAVSPDGPLLPSLDSVEADYTEPAPEYLRMGLQHPIVAELQERLMQLGFMDNDEPTDYFGTMTQEAIKIYQRQNGLAQDGVVGPMTYEAIMASDAKYYAAKKGESGTDIERFQTRLYELGYLSSQSMVTGNFGDSTEEAVKRMQSANGLTDDGTVGRQTINLLYSDEVKANMLSYGDQSDVVLAAQQRLKTLGYMTSEPDGKYGNDTIIAVKQFQSRNDQVVDGYLGPSTRYILNSSDAVPNGLRLGDQGDTVRRVQQLLAGLGYLSSSNTTGYYGDVTESAVKLFQSTNRLSADGSVGTQTMAMLTSGSAKKAPANSGRTSSGGSGNSTAGRTGGTTGGAAGGTTGSGSGSGGTGTPNTGSASGSAAALISVASSKLGCPYVYGAKGPNAFDCSGFVYWCLNQVGVRQSYMTSSGWRNAGRYTRISRYSDLRAGDIIVVSGHVGIVAGGGTVIDASSSNGKVVHRSLGAWWANNFICGWRIFG